MKKYDFLKDCLYNDYILNELSCTEIGKKYNINSVTIWNHLKKYNIPLRAKSIGIRVHFKNNPRADKIYMCIEPNCHNTVSGPNKRCKSCEMKRRYKLGIVNNTKENNGMFNKKHTKETKLKQSKAKMGDKSPMFGKKGEKCPNYIDGRTSRIYYCKEKECNNKISYRAFYYGDGRCQKCEMKRRHELGIMNNRGKNNPCFRHGFFTGDNLSIYFLIKKLEEYKNWRIQIFKRDNYICQECLMEKSGKLNAHHKKRFFIILQEFLQEYNQFSPAEDKETLLRLAINYIPFWDVSNGVTLCKDCHKKYHRSKKHAK